MYFIRLSHTPLRPRGTVRVHSLPYLAPRSEFPLLPPILHAFAPAAQTPSSKGHQLYACASLGTAPDTVGIKAFPRLPHGSVAPPLYCFLGGYMSTTDWEPKKHPSPNTLEELHRPVLTLENVPYASKNT